MTGGQEANAYQQDCIFLAYNQNITADVLFSMDTKWAHASHQPPPPPLSLSPAPTSRARRHTSFIYVIPACPKKPAQQVLSLRSSA